ncbi:Uncharacterised protein [Yersinia rohdei]|uniref:hypothetical protein n=1 Tax=Yersinia rohdei TaxID=29485 RepID=UPI0005E4D07C|nr:hypothetical protein [Yersinia rohdei]CNI84412.1 Uncharacterised protein [Yersinia rohdei]
MKKKLTIEIDSYQYQLLLKQSNARGWSISGYLVWVAQQESKRIEQQQEVN